MLNSVLRPKGMTCASGSGLKFCSVLAGGSQFEMFGEGGGRTQASQLMWSTSFHFTSCFFCLCLSS